MLRIFNISSKIDLTPHDSAFIEQVILMAEKDKSWDTANHISPLIDKIPIFLLKEGDMPEMPKYHDWEKDLVPPESLGFYSRIDTQYFKKCPSIFICPDRIKLHRNKKSLEDYQLTLADITIHEFAHAKMDGNGHQFGYMNNCRELFDSIEEPFANWYVLKYFYHYGNGDYFFKIESGIKNEPSFYKLGYNFFHSKIADDLWNKWKMQKDEICQIATVSTWVKFAEEISKKNNYEKDVKTELEKLFKNGNS